MKTGKIFKYIGAFLKVAVYTVIIAFIITVLLQRFSDNELSFFNYRMFNVETGSMEPKYNIGDVLVSKEVPASEIEVGDAISYLGESGGYNGMIITHEVIGIEEEDGDLNFRAKGISNPVEDPIVHEDQIYGIIVYKSILLSFIYKVISTPLGMYLCIILPLFVMIGYEMLMRMLEKEEEKRGKSTKKNHKFDFDF